MFVSWVSLEEVVHVAKGGVSGTVHLVHRTTPTHGYMVGGKAWTMVTRQPDLEDLQEYVFIHREYFRRNDHYLGWWWEGDKLHFDVSENFPHKALAMNVAKDRGEKAIYDISKGVDIYI